MVYRFFNVLYNQEKNVLRLCRSRHSLRTMIRDIDVENSPVQVVDVMFTFPGHIIKGNHLYHDVRDSIFIENEFVNIKSLRYYPSKYNQSVVFLAKFCGEDVLVHSPVIGNSQNTDITWLTGGPQRGLTLFNLTHGETKKLDFYISEKEIDFSEEKSSVIY